MIARKVAVDLSLEDSGDLRPALRLPLGRRGHAVAAFREKEIRQFVFRHQRFVVDETRRQILSAGIREGHDQQKSRDREEAEGHEELSDVSGQFSVVSYWFGTGW